MKQVPFGPEAARPLAWFDGQAQAAPVASVNGQLIVQGLHIPPGGSLPEHHGRLHYLLLITAGSGWVRINGEPPERIAAGEAISWSVEELGEIGTEDGLSAVWIQYALGGFFGPKRRFTVNGTHWTVYLEAGNQLEQRACDQLERLLHTYDLSRWTFTNQVRICDFATPHSHPVLTLNTRYLNDDRHALATFLHEQIHWFEDGRPEATAAAMDEFRQLYPGAPEGLPAGGTDRESTYLHLIVCPLEYAALVEVLGAEGAREVLRQKRFYTWIYERTLADWEQIHGVLTRHGLLI